MHVGGFAGTRRPSRAFACRRAWPFGQAVKAAQARFPADDVHLGASRVTWSSRNQEAASKMRKAISGFCVRRVPHTSSLVGRAMGKTEPVGHFVY